MEKTKKENIGGKRDKQRLRNIIKRKKRDKRLTEKKNMLIRTYFYPFR